MRVALVSPYSWTYPGGVTRHIEALAGELAATDHEVRVFAPFDHDGRVAGIGGHLGEPVPHHRRIPFDPVLVIHGPPPKGGCPHHSYRLRHGCPHPGYLSPPSVRPTTREGTR